MNLPSELIVEVRAHARGLVREWNLLSGAFGNTGYTYSQCHALFELGQGGALNTVQLAERLLLDKSTASRLLSGLLAKDLVRVQKDTADRRQKWYSLTEAGRRALDQNNCQADQQVEEALQLLTPAERERVREGLYLYDKALNRRRRQAEYRIRPIRREDNLFLSRLIRQVMAEFGTVGAGYSSEDAEIDDMHGVYRQDGHVFYVVERNGYVLGGAGIGPLAGDEKGTCELRKMYFAPELRGLGLGKKLLLQLLDDARRLGYRTCYLETVDRMWQANRLYQQMGFERLERRCGDTGHCSCEAYYNLDL